MIRSITISRYPSDDINPDGFGGYIEGTTEDDQQWILYLDKRGAPTVYWGRREPSGGVIGAPLDLRPPVEESSTRD